jgi:hypothetical protein
MNIQKNLQTVIFIVSAVMFSIWMTSCEKPNNELIMSGDLDFIYEEIPGLGNSDESASGNAFQLPAGLEYASDITGYDPYKSKERFNGNNLQTKQDALAGIFSLTNQDIAFKHKANGADTIMGSGYFVEILIPLKNVTYSGIAVSFPAGLIFHSRSGEYQNGLLIKQVDIVIPSNSTFNLVLQLYCCNASRGASTGNAVFYNPIVSNHAVIMELCSLVANKKVNIEDYYHATSNSPYYELRTPMQSLVWNISTGSSIEQTDRTFINSIANE